MSGKREIICPHCKQWTLWRGDIHDRCLYCGQFLTPEEYPKKVEREIYTQYRTESDFLFIRPQDNKLVRVLKRIGKQFRGLVYYAQIVFFAVISFILWLIGMLAA